MTTPLDQIPLTSSEAEKVRATLRAAGCETDDDIVARGCLGLVVALGARTLMPWHQLAMVRAVRENMSGSGCGLPCYVPPTRFCLVHNTIGGLQQGQAQRYPDAISLCSRELTSEEALHAAAVSAAIAQEGLREAKARFGLEPIARFGLEPVEGGMGDARLVEPEGRFKCSTGPLGEAGPSCDPGQSSNKNFTCPEHATPQFTCRFCLATMIAYGPEKPEVRLHLDDSQQFTSVGRLDAELAEAREGTVDLCVIVASWERKLVRTR
jgi:hypothetical protein